uniref:hypothetical protein n=1 Tax=Gordonia sp. B7-2 TaxID=3420932 RepID=UPI003D8EF231
MAGMRDTDARDEEAILAAATAGHVMAGMPPTGDDIAAAQRVLRGETTAAQEAERLLAKYDRRRG